MGTGALMAAYGLATRAGFSDVTAPMVLGVCLFSLGLFALRVNAEPDQSHIAEILETGPAEFSPSASLENRF